MLHEQREWEGDEREGKTIYEIVWRKSKASLKVKRSVCTWIMNFSEKASDALPIPNK